MDSFEQLGHIYMVQVFTPNKHLLLSSFSHNNWVLAALNPQMFENGQTAWLSGGPLRPCALSYQSHTHVRIGRLQTNTANFQHLCFWLGFSTKTWICCTTTVISEDVLVCAFAWWMSGVCLCTGLLLWYVATPQTTSLMCRLLWQLM